MFFSIPWTYKFDIPGYYFEEMEIFGLEMEIFRAVVRIAGR